jgi:hypothetical protein
MRGRIVAIDAAAEDGDGRPAGFQRPAVGLAVDSTGETADDDEPRAGELPAEHARNLGAVRRARTRADDRGGRTAEQLRVSRTADEETGRRIVDRPEERRKVRLRATEPANSRHPQPSQERSLVERARKHAERLVAWSTYDM